MTSVQDVIAGLKAVLVRIGSARQRLAAHRWTEAADGYRTALKGSSQPEPAEIAALDSHIRHQIAHADHLIARSETAISAVINTLRGEPSAAVHSDAVQHGDGSRYPAGAAWAVSDLPRRVRAGTADERTVGRLMIGGRDMHTMTSGRDGTWSQDVLARLNELGIRSTLRLESHVEMKVAQLMIQLGERQGEVVINHAPCGSQRPLRRGCHQALARYLPIGYTLTVHGTTQDGRPFSHTYQGQA
jgi:hypothetical protein